MPNSIASQAPTNVTKQRDHVICYLNGKRCEVRGEDAMLTLADWLRLKQGKTGTKIVCNEGDCGACSVLVGRLTSQGDSPEKPHRLEYRSIDSCIAFVFQLDCTHVVTVEGLCVDGTLSPIQEAIVNCHGSQCGFCTPGFVTTMHGLVEAEKPLNDTTLRYGLSGNLCRCTGYVQILQAGTSVDAASVARLSELYPDDTMAQPLVNASDQPLLISDDKRTLYVPRTIAEALAYRAKHPRASIVAGATDYGVLHNHGCIETGDLLCLTHVDGMSDIDIRDGMLSIGALACWTDIEDAIETLLPDYHHILTRFGSPQIRQMGTIGGNLASGSPIADSVPLHLLLDAELELASVNGTRRLPLRDFYLGYRNTALRDDELIVRVHTPLPRENESIKLYKISKRRDMDISTLTFAIWVRHEDEVIDDVRIVVGGVGPMVMRLGKSEAILKGKPWNVSSFTAAAETAAHEVSPWTDVRGGAEYRIALTRNLLIKSFFELRECVTP
jgi:xanthine dehydrogenase small subunit